MNSQKRAWRAISLAATLAATISLAFFVGCSPATLDGAAKRAVAAKLISPHLPLGNPSEAGNEPNNQLVLRQQFAASWNAKKRIANWVAWRLVASDIGDTERSQFYADPEIDTPSPKTHDNDPNKSGQVIQKRNSQQTRAKSTLLQSC